MELLLKKKSKKELLDYLANSSLRVSEELERIEQLYDELIRKGQSSPFLKTLVDRLVNEIKIPEPPFPPDAEGLTEKLEEYERNLRALEEALKQTVNFVDQIAKLAPEVEQALERVEKMASIIKTINPTLADTAFRQLSKVRRLNDALISEPKLPILADLEKDLEELERVERSLRSEYEKTIGFIQRELVATRELVERSMSVALLQDKSRLAQELEKLDKMNSRLVELKNNPQPITPRDFYLEIQRIRELSESIMRSSLSQDEIKVFETLLWLRTGSENKVFELSDLIELVSRRSNISINKTLETLYKLSKTGAVRLIARVVS